LPRMPSTSASEGECSEGMPKISTLWAEGREPICKLGSSHIGPVVLTASYLVP
jgi:hypothetical protein